MALFLRVSVFASPCVHNYCEPSLINIDHACSSIHKLYVNLKSYNRGNREAGEDWLGITKSVVLADMQNCCFGGTDVVKKLPITELVFLPTPYPLDLLILGI